MVSTARAGCHAKSLEGQSFQGIRSGIPLTPVFLIAKRVLAQPSSLMWTNASVSSVGEPRSNEECHANTSHRGGGSGDRHSSTAWCSRLGHAQRRQPTHRLAERRNRAHQGEPEEPE